jgi:hypothetical protein
VILLEKTRHALRPQPIDRGLVVHRIDHERVGARRPTFRPAFSGFEMATPLILGTTWSFATPACA